MLRDECGLFHINKFSRGLVGKFEKLDRFRVLLFLYLHIHIDLLLLIISSLQPVIKWQKTLLR